ncbi:Dynamin- GTPase protein [Yamadazyma tenuis]|uniref:Uncharacterized protein n=1 Tax=Candida tenuis (strain ATCC 10573 / BCRC 21748 / CBS 615 / JCM 9827 / NBRC 10315 / NRRL Y-1498 / VKM Y-70) TaxID=590646 RepID=G3B305_CANTC|nr:uncharacterized protein CANTEDRAFT_122098 [Yamadazyma tenuis ATCC 10573]EGV64050.1 hypothetical protein CANTEDRAFT_122098 [Yamadazyma tenuis ATCC 10573]WEJ96321.1 Dynamin- GTPase protein [Yamadazyma tenuis]
MSFSDLIPVVNKLQDIVTTTQVSDLDLPILAVVGSQSCGKSSVLENIVGKDFLPRGTGIVTRRPLILQLVNLKPDEFAACSTSQSNSESDEYYNDDEDDELKEINLEEHLKKLTMAKNGGSKGTSRVSADVEYGEFLHLPGKRFYNFKEIRHEIEIETNRVAGSNKGINRIPINLKIYSTKVLDLTLVDLPGITKVPIGDQPGDIEKQTRNLILEYISRPNCIILAVSPANVDLVNSESLKLARQVDPTGKRTIGILTKLDLMDEGTNALDILKGNVYPLKMGFVGIINRSQYDISINKSLTDSLGDEEAFFRNHQAYRTIANKCGTRYLSIKLNQILMSHIREKLPDIKAKLNTLIGQTEQELIQYGGSPLDVIEDKSVLILNLMTKFAQNFINSIEGTNINEISTKELCGGARLYHIYNEVFGNDLSLINPTHNLTLRDIRTAIRNSTGSRPSLFVPELAFDLLVKPQIKLLEEPSKKCVELVYEELMKIVHNICSNGIEINRYPKLQMKLIEVVSDLLRERLGPTIKYVESLIEINKSYINTNHPNFVGAATAMRTVLEEKRKAGEISKKPVVESDDSDEIEDINEIDEDLPSSKVNESVHIQEKDPSDSYLNYFFGKDPITHQQYLTTQAQLNPAPFKFPNSHETLPLQFNNDSSSTSSTATIINNNNESFEIDEGINELNEKEQLECELIRRLIISYFGIIREIIKDQVPKSIMCLLVNFIRDNIQNQLVIKLYNEKLFDNLLVEDENIQIEREKCYNLLKTYKDAAKIINEVV